MSELSNRSEVRRAARDVLHNAWVADVGYCVPNRDRYPHLWLWDSCFHSLAWMGVGDRRCVSEISAVFEAQTADGFVPHMRYWREPDYLRGPRPDASCLTQPPVYGIVLERLASAGFVVPQSVLDSAVKGLKHLWRMRQEQPGLIAIYHPWESGADDSPRWDDCVGTSTWTRDRYTRADRYLLEQLTFADFEAVGSAAFASCPAMFNGVFAHSCDRLGLITNDDELVAISAQVGAAMDRMMWNEAEQLWNDLPIVGPGASQARPTLDGVLGALATSDRDKATRALDQVMAPERFWSEYGVRYVPPQHATYEANSYWRGPAWPQVNYLVWTAAHRWSRHDIVRAVEEMTVRGAFASGFAEYWNADTGAGLGAIPQTWAAVVAAMDDEFAPHAAH